MYLLYYIYLLYYLQGDTIFGSILPKHPKSLLDLVKYANKELKNWLYTHKYDILGSIIVIDDYVNCEALVEYAVEMARLPINKN